MELCRTCVVPLEERLIPFLPKEATPFRKEEGLCNACYQLKKDTFFEDYFGENNLFKREFQNYLGTRRKVLFAYSGGLDSTVVLDKLNKECKKRGIELLCFTLNHGFKGDKTLKNINQVLKFEGISFSHQMLDLTQRRIERCDRTGFEFYADFLKKNILPCGKNCNSIFNFYYKKILEEFGESILFTGGDTPKFNLSFSRYSIFWKKPEFIVLRGGAAFGLNKNSNREYIIKMKIPWKDPLCGGYDTDCLLPGAIFKNLAKNKKFKIDELVMTFPVLLEYLSERVRWGVIKREDALKKMDSLEISDSYSYNEIYRLAKVKNDN